MTSQSATVTTSQSGSSAPQVGLRFPTAVSEDHRYLVDDHGDPYMVIGDSPQCLSANVSTGEMEDFFADRHQRGFNVAWVNLLCGPYTHGSTTMRTFDGVKPFVNDGDLSTPNEPYFNRMDTMVSLAAKYGITLFLDPAETGSFKELLESNGVDKTRQYGEFLGQRYKNAKNIVWMLGNDYQQGDWDRFDQYEMALSRGIRAADPAKLQTIELNPSVSTSYDDPVWPPLIDVATAYSYFPTYDAVLKAYDAAPTQPVVMIEANYEGENNSGGPTTTDETLRRQEWWTALSGATGQLYGHGKTWGMNNSDWRKFLDTPAVAQLGVLADFLSARRWQDLVPDQSHSFLVSGMGTYSGDGDVLENDYAVAATTPDGALALVYTPVQRTLNIDQSRLDPRAVARWLDPGDGTTRPAAPPFDTPGRNSVGDSDWALVFELPSG